MAGSTSINETEDFISLSWTITDYRSDPAVCWHCTTEIFCTRTETMFFFYLLSSSEHTILQTLHVHALALKRALIVSTVSSSLSVFRPPTHRNVAFIFYFIYYSVLFLVWQILFYFFVVIYCYLLHSSDLTVFLHMFSELPNSFTEINWGCVQMYPAVSPVSAAERSQLHSRPDRDGTNTSTCLFRVTSIFHLWLWTSPLLLWRKDHQ